MPALVLGLDSMTGLQTARILHDRGIPVSGVVEQRRHYASRSRAVDQVLGGSPEGIVEVLHRFGRTVDGAFVVIPCSDAWVAALVEAKPEWPPDLRVVISNEDQIASLMDKARFARFAAVHGIPVPATVIVEGTGDIDAVLDQLDLPVVVKPAIKSPGWDAAMGGKVGVVHDEGELVGFLTRGMDEAGTLVVQEWVAGGEDRLISFNGYFDHEGEALAAFVARKLRQWPPGAGTSASGEEVQDDEVLQIAVELFQKAGFRGLAYVEVKRAPDGHLFVIEPNVGRPTGRSAISEAGGVELVYSAYRDALGLAAIAPNRQMHRGVKWIYLRHDIQAAAVAIRRGDLTITDWLRSVRGPKAYALWSARDPLPFIIDIYHTLKTHWRTSGSAVPRRYKTLSRTASIEESSAQRQAAE